MTYYKIILSLYIILLINVGWSQDCDNPLVHFSIINVDINAGTLDIYMENEVDIAAFQIPFTGMIITDVYGGLAAEYEYIILGGGPSNLVLGSMFGPVIPPGEGILTTVSFTNYQNEDICFVYQFGCLGWQNTPYDGCDIDFDNDGDYDTGDNMPMIADLDVNIICPSVGECYSASDEILGCTYLEATNYNPNATDDDGSCEFMWGDVNHDGELNIQDLILIVNEILSF